MIVVRGTKKKKRKRPGSLNSRNFVSAKLVRSESPLIAGYFIDFGVEYQREIQGGLRNIFSLGFLEIDLSL
jgi:hypothetical protein